MKKILIVLYVLLTALAANAKTIDADTAKSMLDADKNADVYRCKNVVVDEGNVATETGDDIYLDAKPSKTIKGKRNVRHAVKSGKDIKACTRQRLNENTDNLANKRRAKPVYAELN